MSKTYTIVNWCERYVEQALALLEKYAESSLFLLSNLKKYGSYLGHSDYSGNFKLILDEYTVVAVFCLAKNGTILLQSDRDDDYSSNILEECKAEPITIKQCVGEWSLASSLWQRLKTQLSTVKTDNYSKEKLYKLALTEENITNNKNVRLLSSADFEQWYKMEEPYCHELNFPFSNDKQAEYDEYRELIASKHSWGYFINDKLIARAAYNAIYDKTAQIGGVYTIPEYRKQGYAKELLKQLLSDSYTTHHINKLILFTGENNHAAQKLYNTLGFDYIGDYGLFFS